MVEDPLQLLRIKCVADEQGDGVLGELLLIKPSGKGLPCEKDGDAL